jgi:hypothetical protein
MLQGQSTYKHQVIGSAMQHAKKIQAARNAVHHDYMYAHHRLLTVAAVISATGHSVLPMQLAKVGLSYKGLLAQSGTAACADTSLDSMPARFPAVQKATIPQTCVIAMVSICLFSEPLMA